jgi:hypothetical protein
VNFPFKLNEAVPVEANLQKFGEVNILNRFCVTCERKQKVTEIRECHCLLGRMISVAQKICKEMKDSSPDSKSLHATSDNQRRLS